MPAAAAAPAPAVVPATPAPQPAASAPFSVASLLDDEDLEGALEGIGIPAPREEGEDAFDLAAALDEAPGGKVEPAIQDVFRAFKKGIEAQIGAEEWGAHYDLAIAYREMGLVDDAVEQLEIVRRAGGLGIEGIALLATCKVEQGAPEAAVELLREALKQETHPASLMALHYDLAEAYRSAGRGADALSEYRVVAEQEPHYREVQQRISELG
jgi:tetratricopeptide (TPR) repeat protein